MPHTTTPLTPKQKRAEKVRKVKRILEGGGTVGRDDSDDELGTEDHPWEWIYESANLNSEDCDGPADDAKRSTPKRRKGRNDSQPEGKIIGVKNGNFQCFIGDTVLLKAEGHNEAWVGAICSFLYDENDDMAANFLCKT